MTDFDSGSQNGGRTSWIQFILNGNVIGYVAVYQGEIALVSGCRARRFLALIAKRAGEPASADLLYRILRGEVSIGAGGSPSGFPDGNIELTDEPPKPSSAG